MFPLNKDRADALCAIIACGFMDKKNDTRIKSGNGFTEFIYEKDAKEYKDLGKALLKAHIQVNFKQVRDKMEAPLILAKSRYLTQSVQEGIQADTKDWSAPLEQLVNKVDGDALRGAYLGGYNTIGKTRLVGVSDLYLYKPRCRADEEVKANSARLREAYTGAQKVTNAVVDHLNENFGFISRYVTIDAAECRPVTEEYKEGLLFASVHGMTRSIQYAPPTIDSDKHAVHFELALGAATSKVASCIPCSLFMAAVGQPATATHLGRGDNWNFPRHENTELRERWRQYVNACYEQGADKLKNLTGRRLLDDWFGACKDGGPGDISGMFLEALTYESSFLDKLKRSLAAS